MLAASSGIHASSRQAQQCTRALVPTGLPGSVHILHEWGLRQMAEDAALATSELVTNAADVSIVLPDRPPVALRLLASGTSLVIEVWDQSPFDLEPREADDEDECGRGLTVVAALSDHWGCQRTGYRRKVVWAELAGQMRCSRRLH